ncbi:MAG: HAD-IIB family hydrolase [Desulfomonilaceae bacterium]
MKTVVFTDLDATLLDSDTYSWTPAINALEALKERRASIVLVSSKTFAEMEPIHGELGLGDPFVVENGGAIVFRSEMPIASQLQALGRGTDPVPKGDLLMLPMGVRYERLVTALAEISMETGIPLKGFATMSVEEVASLTGLGIRAAERARIRDFDEPFLLLERLGMPENAIEKAAGHRGLTTVRGSRFWHLIGHEGKGRAVSLLIEAFRRAYGNLVTIGLGDSPNDYPFLELVDIPVIVGGADREGIVPDSLTKARRTSDSGPEGWNVAILTWLSEVQT